MWITKQREKIVEVEILTTSQYNDRDNNFLVDLQKRVDKILKKFQGWEKRGKEHQFYDSISMDQNPRQLEAKARI